MKYWNVKKNDVLGEIWLQRYTDITRVKIDWSSDAVYRSYLLRLEDAI